MSALQALMGQQFPENHAASLPHRMPCAYRTDSDFLRRIGQRHTLGMVDADEAAAVAGLGMLDAIKCGDARGALRQWFGDPGSGGLVEQLHPHHPAAPRLPHDVMIDTARAHDTQRST